MEDPPGILSVVIKEFLYGDAIGIAYLLDPCLLGDNMLMHEKSKVEDVLFDHLPRKLM